MGFRTGSYATIWTVESASDTRTKARISISRKNKQTGEYDTDFSGFVDFTYTNFKIFSFETQAEINSGGSGNSGYSTEPQKSVDSGEIDDSQLPF